MNRLIMCLCAVLTMSAVLSAKEATPAAKATGYAIELQQLETETQTQIQALEQQLAGADGLSQEEINRQIQQIKMDYSVRRLEIMLNQAEAESDEARASEIRHALDGLLNPPTPTTVRVDRPAPSAPGLSPESRENNR